MGLQAKNKFYKIHHRYNNLIKKLDCFLLLLTKQSSEELGEKGYNEIMWN